MELYDDIDPRVLTAAIRVLPEPPGFVFNQVLPDREIPDITFAINDITSINRAAHFRAFDAPVEIGKGPSLVRTTGEIPAVGEGYLVGEYARLLQEAARGSNIDPQLLALALNYSRQGFNAIKARMELARAELLSTGKFTLSGEGGLTGIEADFGVPNGNFVTLANEWDDPTNNIVSQISDLADIGEAASGIRPDTMIGGRTTMAYVMANEGMRQLYGNAFGAAQQLSIGQVNQVLAQLDLPTFATTVNARGQVVPLRPGKVDVDGTTTDVFPAKGLVMYPEGMIGETLWGPTFEALELASTGAITAEEAPGLIAMVQKEGNPGKLFTIVNATGLPVLSKPAALVVVSDTSDED